MEVRGNAPYAFSASVFCAADSDMEAIFVGSAMISEMIDRAKLIPSSFVLSIPVNRAGLGAKC
jgi:hypothetical protein